MVMLELLPTIKAAVAQMTLHACTQKWTEEKWGCALKRLIPYMSAVDSFPLMDHLLELTMNVAIPNVYILNCLIHAVATQIISFRAAVSCIIKYNNIFQPYHLASLVSFVDNILIFLTSSNDNDAIYCLLELLPWLLDVLLKCLNAISDTKNAAVNEGNEQCIHGCILLLKKIIQDDWRFVLVNLVHKNRNESQIVMGENIEQLQMDILNVIQGQNSSFSPEFINQIKIAVDFKLGVKIYDKKIEPILSCVNQPLNLSLNALISMEAMLNPCEDVASLLSKVYSIEATLGLSRSHVYLDLMRSCLLMVVENVSKQDELKWASFTYLKLPALISEMSQDKEGGQQEVVEAFERLLQMTNLLDMADSKSNCDCLLYLVNELTNKYPLISEAQNRKIISHRQNDSLRSKFFDTVSPAKETANLILRAEPTVTTILKSLDTSKNAELILGVMTHMMSGKSFELLLSAAAGTSKLQSFAAKLIKVNELSKMALTTETARSSQVRATLFDISFLMLCHIAQLYGLESIVSNSECSNTFFQMWAVKFLPENDGATSKPFVANGLVDQNKVEILLGQFSSNSELTTSLTRWNEVCYTTQFAVQELIYAWDAGVIDLEAFKSTMEHVKWNMCSLGIVAAAWLSNSLETSCKSIREKMIIALKLLLTPCPPHDTNIANYMERSHLAKIILSEMTTSVLKNNDNEKVYTMSILNPKKMKPPNVLLNETLRSVAERGSCSSEDVYIFNQLLKEGGIIWFAKISTYNLLNQSYGVSELNGVACLILSIFHLDIEGFTSALLVHILPSLLRTPTSSIYPSLDPSITGTHSNLSPRGNILSDPRGLVFAQVVVACIHAWLSHCRTCLDHMTKPKCRKRNRSEYLYEMGDADGNGERPAKMRCPSSELVFQLSDASTYNETSELNFSSSVTEPNNEYKDVLAKHLGNLFNLFNDILTDSIIGAQYYFVINFLKQILKLDSHSIQHIFQYLPQSTVCIIVA